MNCNQILYQIYPLGFCGAPKHNDGIAVSRILRVIDWIPHFRRLGITAVLFNPLFESDRHGYDTRDFSKVDCRLGTNDDFLKVCDALHDAGIKVLLDGVFNHVGRGFGYFRDVIRRREDSPYKDWFYISFADRDHRDGFRYEGWEGHNELVRLNLQNETVRRFLIERTDQWIAEFGIDGLRLDVAYMLDHGFMHELCSHIRSYDPDFLFIGEMTGGNYNDLLQDGLLNSVTNYEFRGSLVSAMNIGNLYDIGETLNRQFSGNGAYCGRPLLTFGDNHDVNRLASVLNDPNDLSLCYALMFAMPGIPCIYYGSEWGVKGVRTRFSDQPLRPEFRRPKWNELTEYIANLCRMRRTYSVFSDGDYTPILLQNEQLVFRRRNARGQLTFAMNIDSRKNQAAFDPQVHDGIDLLHTRKVHFDETMELEGKTAYFWYTDWI